MPAPSEAQWASLASHMDTKVMGYLRCARALLPSMRRAGWGRIVNVSGLGARRTGDVVGTIRNVAVVALAKNLADELAGTGIAVTTVHPGLTRTEKVDAMLEARARAEGRTVGDVEASAAENLLMGRLPTAEDVAQVIAFLASPRSVSGQRCRDRRGRRRARVHQLLRHARRRGDRCQLSVRRVPRRTRGSLLREQVKSEAYVERLGFS